MKIYIMLMFIGLSREGRDMHCIW